MSIQGKVSNSIDKRNPSKKNLAGLKKFFQSISLANVIVLRQGIGWDTLNRSPKKSSNLKIKYPFSRAMKVCFGNLLSPFVPVRKNRVAIVAKASVPFAGNLRCVADELLREKNCEVIVYKDGPIEADTCEALEHAGAKVLNGFSFAALCTVLSCEKIFVGHSIRDAHIGIAKTGRTIINLWHGVPLKRIELKMPDRLLAPDSARRQLMKANADLYDYVISSSPVDAKVMAESFGVSLDKVIKTGLPRFDYLKPDYPFPADLIEQQKKFKSIAAGRKVVLYAPTFRELGSSPFKHLDALTIGKLQEFARRNNCVIALRPHPYDQKSIRDFDFSSDSCFMDASSTAFPEVAIVLANTQFLITDYSSVWVDFYYLERPIFGLMPDFAAYSNEERGFVHDLDEIFPGPIFQNWQDLLEALEGHKSFNSKVSRFGAKNSKLEELPHESVEKLLPSSKKIHFTWVMLDQIKN